MWNSVYKCVEASLVVTVTKGDYVFTHEWEAKRILSNKHLTQILTVLTMRSISVKQANLSKEACPVLSPELLLLWELMERSQ